MLKRKKDERKFETRDNESQRTELTIKIISFNYDFLTFRVNIQNED